MKKGNLFLPDLTNSPGCSNAKTGLKVHNFNAEVLATSPLYISPIFRNHVSAKNGATNRPWLPVDLQDCEIATHYDVFAEVAPCP